MAEGIKREGPGQEVASSDIEIGEVEISADDLLLAKLGYKQEFYRKLGFFGTYN